jgi:hypothetical protein
MARRIMAVASSTVGALTLGVMLANGAVGSAGPTHIPRQPGAPAHVHYPPVSGQRHVQSNLVYHGGPVVQKFSNTYAIFWEPK